MRPRVLSVIPTLGLGGAEAMATDIAIGLERHGFESSMHVLAELRGERGNTLAGRLKCAGVEFNVGALSSPRSLSASVRLRKTIQRIKPHLVLSHLPASEVLSAVTLGTAPGRWPTFVRVLHLPVLSRAQKILSPAFAVTIACSREVAEAATRAGLSRVVHIDNGVRIPEQDLPKFPSRHDLAQPHKFAMVGHLRGGLHGQKGVDIAIHALSIASKTRKVDLHIFGTSASDDVEIRRYAASLEVEDQITLHGVTSDLTGALTNLRPDACIMPSRTEGLSVALMEFSVLGLPVILSDIQSFRDAAHPQFHWRFFRNESAEDLARGMLTKFDFSASTECYAETSRHSFGQDRMLMEYAHHLHCARLRRDR